MSAPSDHIGHGNMAGMASPLSLHWSDAAVSVHRTVVGPVDNNVFVVRCHQTGDAVLIDAANEHDVLLPLAESLGVRSVIETHGHWDHIQAVPAMRQAGYSVGVTALDSAMLPAYDTVIDDDVVLEVGRLRLRTIFTPGHTPGSVCFRLEDTPLLFSGDTLFPGGVGNTALPGGSFADILESVSSRLFSVLPASTVVLPGHGLDTTIGAESPHIDEWASRGW